MHVNGQPSISQGNHVKKSHNSNQINHLKGNKIKREPKMHVRKRQAQPFDEKRTIRKTALTQYKLVKVNILTNQQTGPWKVHWADKDNGRVSQSKVIDHARSHQLNRT